MALPRTLRVGIDVGGTFTDLTAQEMWSGNTLALKVPTTPREPHRCAVDALLALLARYDERPEVAFLAHSTTIATNALLGQLGLELPRVALVTTEGFVDIIEIGRQNRSEVYNLFVERPRPLVAREDRFTVRERIDHRGDVIVPLDLQSLDGIGATIRGRAITDVAVCLLHSYANDTHERRVADALAAMLPALRIARSADVDPQFREYERFSTTIVNAVLAPIVARYLERLVAELRAHGIETPFYVMRSDGGMTAFERAIATPAAILESGPASGVVATAELGQRIAARHLLSFDMGGTTAKAGTVVDGTVQIAGEFEAAGRTHSGRAVRGSGYPVRFPFVDLAEISAGCGTIAWIDDANSLRVGPVSAGADPGPACYGRSELATVTDANVVLGRLHPEYLLGGAFPIDARRSRSAIGAIAAALELGVEAAAAGIVTLIDDAMAKVLRIVTVERGLDPRVFTLAAFGGGGPLHACAVADALGIGRVLVPEHPGLFSAQGLLLADLHATYVRPVLECVDALAFERLQQIFDTHEQQGRVALLEQGARPETLAARHRYDARYRGQSFELPVEHGDSLEAIALRFHAAHETRYGYRAPDEPIELVNARSTIYGKTLAVGGRTERYETATHRGTLRSGTRKLWIDGRLVEAQVFSRAAMAPNERYDGPLLVEQYDTTTYVAPRWSVTVEEATLILERTEGAA